MLSKLKSAPPQQFSDFELATAKMDRERQIWHALLAEQEALKVAALWQNTTEVEHESDRFTWARAKVQEHFATKKMPAPWRIPNLTRELEERMGSAHPGWMAAQQEFEIARSKETSRLAIALQARQREAVNEIADALKALHVAMKKEKAVRQELESTAPNPTSAYLPDCAPQIGYLDQHTSAPFEWRQRMRRCGLLD